MVRSFHPPAAAGERSADRARVGPYYGHRDIPAVVSDHAGTRSNQGALLEIHPPQSEYEVNDRAEMLTFIPGGVTSILDVGCGAGGFGRALRARFGDDLAVVGIEPVPAARAAAGRAGYDEVLAGYFPQALTSGRRFDCIVFNDVLEHLVDPWAALRQAGRHLSPGGTVVASIPNILFAPVLYEIVRHRQWRYTDAGTLDRTHLRFFTKRSIADLFESSGLVVSELRGINNDWQWSRWARYRRLARFTGEYQWLQFAVVARVR